MNWRESLEPTAPRLVITFLLFAYCIFSFTFFPMHFTACREEGVDCSSYVYHVSLYQCLRINFYQAHQSPSMYFVNECSKINLLWVIPLAFVLYVISPSIYRWFTRSVDALRYGSKNEIVTFVLCVLTLMPGLLIGIAGESFILAYILFPYGLFYTCAIFIRLGRFLIPIVVSLVLVFTAFTAHTVFRKWEITHARWYLLWVMYLVVTFLFICVISLEVSLY